jgi:hypothetical protein
MANKASTGEMVMKTVEFVMVTAVCVAMGTATFGQTNSSTWEQDWEAFGKYVSPYLVNVKMYPPQQGSGWYTPLPDSFKELTTAVDGHTVSWVGEVQNITFTDGIARVSLRMPTQTISVQPEHSAVLDSLQVTSKKDETASWKNVTHGDWVRFRTTIKGSSIFPGVFFMMGLGNHEGEWSVCVSTDGGTAVEQLKNVPKVLPSDLLPSFTDKLNGAKDDKPVRVRNPNDFWVAAGVRSGSKGINFTVPPNGVYTAFVPDGKYDIYFVYSSNPNALFQGDSFTLQGNGVEIKIVKVVNGNYGIRQVK